MSVAAFSWEPGQLELAAVEKIYDAHQPIALPADVAAQVAQTAEALKQTCQTGSLIYGVNTGFGALAGTVIPETELFTLQRNLVLSHCAGVGERLSDSVVRLILLLKINALAQGFSGVRYELINALMKFYNRGCYPYIRAKGSVGASGDLAPLADMAAVLLGVGECRYKNRTITAKTALRKVRLKALVLQPKEGLALLNGTQVSTALALEGLFLTQRLFAAALCAGAMSVEAMAGHHGPFDARIHEVRRHAGQIYVAKRLREWLKGSEIARKQSHRVQDPYSLRCQPQVLGACYDQIQCAVAQLSGEINAVSDNPLIFLQENKKVNVVSGGNFHAEVVGFAADNLALALAEIGALSERRIALFIDAHLSHGLPAFLVENSGLQSGFMIPQVTATALACENKWLARAVSVESLPTSASQEDHVSMATLAARRLNEMARNTAYILAIEFLMAAQGLNFRLPQKTSVPLQKVWTRLREKVAFYSEDQPHSESIEWVAAQLLQGELLG